VHFTVLQQDALVEILNTGFASAGAALTKLTGQGVGVEVAQISMCPLDELSSSLRPIIGGDIATVHQIFAGSLVGDALLAIDHQSGTMLKELLTNEPAMPLEIDASAREVLTEIGNVLLNACVGTFGNLLDARMSFSVPLLTLETLDGVVSSIRMHQDGLRYALIIHAALRMKRSTLSGYLIVVLSGGSIERLIRGVDKWERDHA